MPLKAPAWLSSVARRVRALRGPSHEEIGFARLRDEGVDFGQMTTAEAALQGLAAGLVLGVSLRDPQTSRFEPTGAEVHDPDTLRALLVGVATGKAPPQPYLFRVADRRQMRASASYEQLTRIVERCFREPPEPPRRP